MPPKIIQQLSDIVPGSTAHTSGEKFVFLKSDDSVTSLTQFAYGKFACGEGVEEHSHATMEECFFFINGEGVCRVHGEEYALKPGTFLRVPAGVLHSLRAEETSVLEFVYFGVAING